MTNKNDGRRIHCFFSGGRDSALTCYIAHKVARLRGWQFKLVHIDTTVSIKQTREYIHRYAEWLGAELVIIRPQKTFKELAVQYGIWPALYPPRFRWCYRDLKLKPMIKYIHENYSEGDLLVLGVRKGESRFRDKYYTSTFFERDYDGVKAKVWAPLLYADELTLLRLLERFNVPQNPVWRLGFSGECLCLAGAPVQEVAQILRNFPEEREMLLDIDDAINRSRKSGKPAAPFRIAQKGYKTLREFYEKAVKTQLSMEEFIHPYGYGKACQGSCLL
jgi:3'-phosphoadenosine 5'-phosphosulfate sulfotransferase (PAPS reductase)/FAD synthetase